jgi:hypothetical protein
VSCLGCDLFQMFIWCYLLGRVIKKLFGAVLVIFLIIVRVSCGMFSLSGDRKLRLD